jgi:hypothetical protein
MEDIFFDVDFLVDENKKSSGGSITYKAQQKLLNKVIEKAKEIKANKIVTNGNLASVIQDSGNYKMSNLLSISLSNINPGGLYTMGQIDGIKIFVDPYMRWDDNYIHFENDDEKLVRKLKIKSVENTLTEEDNNRIGRIYSGLVKDTNGILI